MVRHPAPGQFVTSSISAQQSENGMDGGKARALQRSGLRTMACAVRGACGAGPSNFHGLRKTIVAKRVGEASPGGFDRSRAGPT